MQTLKGRFRILLLMLFLTAASANLLQYDVFHETESSLQAISKVPINVGVWRGRDHMLAPWVYDLLETHAIIHRNYSSGERSVFLSVVYYPDTKVGFHNPEACLGAQGIELLKHRRRLPLVEKTVVSINELTYQHDNSYELVYYFYKAGSYIGDSYLNLRFHLALNKFRTRPKSGALIRVSTPLQLGSIEEARGTLQHFINALYPYLMTAL